MDAEETKEQYALDFIGTEIYNGLDPWKMEKTYKSESEALANGPGRVDEEALRYFTRAKRAAEKGNYRLTRLIFYPKLVDKILEDV